MARKQVISTGTIFIRHYEGANISICRLLFGPQYSYVIYIYHNTFTGAGHGVDLWGGHCGGETAPPQMPVVRVVNNLYSGPKMYPTSGLNCNKGLQNSLGMYNTNHAAILNENINRGTNGNCFNNTQGGPNPIWRNPLTDVLYPPAGHAALNSAMRLDQTWTVNSTSYPALPGMAGGYYPDPLPIEAHCKWPRQKIRPADRGNHRARPCGHRCRGPAWRWPRTPRMMSGLWVCNSSLTG